MEVIGNYEFFERLAILKPGMTVYNPGCGDVSIDDFLPDATIINLDIEDPYYERKLTDLKSTHKIKGDYNRSPFRNNTFDMVFFGDLHADDEAISEIVRTLKPGGWLILDTLDCRPDKSGSEPIDYPPIAANEYIKRSNLPFKAYYLEIFEKT